MFALREIWNRDRPYCPVGGTQTPLRKWLHFPFATILHQSLPSKNSTPDPLISRGATGLIPWDRSSAYYHIAPVVEAHRSLDRSRERSEGRKNRPSGDRDCPAGLTDSTPCRLLTTVVCASRRHGNAGSTLDRYTLIADPPSTGQTYSLAPQYLPRPDITGTLPCFLLMRSTALARVKPLLLPSLPPSYLRLVLLGKSRTKARSDTTTTITPVTMNRKPRTGRGINCRVKYHTNSGKGCTRYRCVRM